jgi:hypothetical protein
MDGKPVLGLQLFKRENVSKLPEVTKRIGNN